MRVEYRVVDMPWLGGWRYVLEKRVMRRWWDGFWQRVDTFTNKDDAISLGKQFMLEDAEIVWQSHPTSAGEQK